jgi:transcriptional/translational regulatory protein YebC/TACO1
MRQILFEGYAPHGIAVLVETSTTDNNNRTVANVRAVTLLSMTVV